MSNHNKTNGFKISINTIKAEHGGESQQVTSKHLGEKITQFIGSVIPSDPSFKISVSLQKWDPDFGLKELVYHIDNDHMIENNQ